MAISVTIANLAASKLGADDQMASPDDDTNIARSISAVWDLVRLATLRDHPWNFAIRRAQLPAQALDAVPFPYTSSFKLPADWLRLIELLTTVPRDDWEVEGGAILANVDGPLPVRYVADIDEPSLWDSLFTEAFACRLAYQIADRITGDSSRQAAMWQAYQDALSQAKRVDARENPPTVFAPTEWELARTCGAGLAAPYAPPGYPT